MRESLGPCEGRDCCWKIPGGEETAKVVMEMGLKLEQAVTPTGVTCSEEAVTLSELHR